MKKKFMTTVTLTIVVLAMLVGLIALPAGAADHLDAPGLTSPYNDGRLDINDLYVFQSPSNPDNTVMIMTVNPAAGVLSPETFNRRAKYEFAIDNDGDAKRESHFKLKFKTDGDRGPQEIRLYRKFNGRIASGHVGETIEVPGGAKLHVGTFDDPFFFDLDAFLGTNGRSFCDGNETDFFAGLNVSAIVLEVPSEWLGAEDVGIWAWIKYRGRADRMGRPAINTVFIPSNPFEPDEPSLKNRFNSNKPHRDQDRFRDEIVDTLALFYPAGDPTIDALADILLPDILTYNSTSTEGFLNGRQLANDVIDTELGLVTNNIVTSDCVDANDVPFSNEFPYLAPAHTN
ncbi:MAG: DUF4331 family protein [Chloroflexota bacterium]